MTPRILIFAGPNGAGKTTFAREYLPHEAGCPVFINADLIAEGISPFQPESVPAVTVVPPFSLSCVNVGPGPEALTVGSVHAPL